MLNHCKAKIKNIRAVNDPIACFGKLALQAEFIRYRVTPGTMASLDIWIQEGFSRFSRQLDADAASAQLNNIPPIYYLLGNGHRQPYIGMSTMSHDSCGRHYPLTVNRCLMNPLAKEFQTAIPVALRAFYQSAAQICQTIAAQSSSQDFLENIQQISAISAQLNRREFLTTIVKELSAITWQQFMQGINRYYPTLHETSLVNIVADVLSGAKVHAQQALPWGMRLPLVENKLFLSAAFWLQLIDTVLEAKQWHYQVFWHGPSPSCKPAVTIYFKALPSSYLRQLVDQESKFDNLFCLARYARLSKADVNNKNEVCFADNTSLLDVGQQWVKIILKK